MSTFPGPVRSDKAEEAEARLNSLHRRFRAVSRGIDHTHRGRDTAGAAGPADRFSPFELALVVAGIGFVGWAVLRLSGMA